MGLEERDRKIERKRDRNRERESKRKIVAFRGR